MGGKGRKDDEDPNRRPPQRSPEHKGKGSNSNLRRGLRLIGRAWMPPAPTTTTIGPPPRTPPGPTPIGRTNETLGQESQGTSAQAEAREEPMVFEMEPELESAPSSSSSVPDEEFTPLESDHLWGVPAGAPTPQHVLNRRYDSASSQRSTSSPLPTAYTHQIGQACIIPDLEEGMAQEEQGSQVDPPTPDSLSCPAEGQSSCIAANEDEASGNQVQAEAFAGPNVTGVNGLLGLSGRFQVLYYSDDDAPQPPTHPAVVQHGLLTPAPTPEPTPQPAPPPALEFWLPPDPMQEADFQTSGAGPSNSKKFEEDDGREHE